MNQCYLTHLQRPHLLVLVLMATTFQARGQVTSVSLTSASKLKQPPAGYWVDTERNDLRLLRLSDGGNRAQIRYRAGRRGLPSSIRPGQRFDIDTDFDGILGEYRYSGDSCFRGLHSTVEKRVPGVRPKCPQYSWWSPAQLCLRDNRRAARARIFSRKTDDACQKTREEEWLTVDYERFVGASFARAYRGAYLYQITVPSRGRTQYKGLLTLRWDYRLLLASSTRPQRLTVRLGEGTEGNRYTLLNNAGLSGQYEFQAVTPARYVFLFELLDAQGTILHTDVLAARFPRG